MDQKPLTRRRLLAGTATIGSVGALGGAGVRALFNDGERAQGNLQSGALGLEVAWESQVDRADGGKTVERYPDRGFAETFGDGIEVPDVRDGDSGTVTLAARSCANPGVVWSRIDGTAESDLAEAIEATASVGSCENDEGRVVAEGSLADVLRTLEEGILLVSDVGRLGKVEYENGGFFVEEGGTVLEQDDQHALIEFVTAGTTTRIVLDDFAYKNSTEIVAFDFEVKSGHRIASATVKGGPDTKRYTYPCVSHGEDLRPPDNPGRNPSEVSHVSFRYCDLCVDCSPVCLTLDWELNLPEDHDVDDGETLDLDVDLFAQQCRHNPTPENPWQ